MVDCRHTYIKVHPAIDTHDKSVKDIKNLCFQVHILLLR